MNTAIAFDKFDSRIDQVATAEADRYQKRHFFSLAVNQFIMSRVDPKSNAPFSLTATNRLRAELGPLYIGPETLTSLSGIIPLDEDTLAEPYLMMSYLRVQNSNGDLKPCFPVSGAQAAMRIESPFFNGQEEPMYEETAAGLYVHAGKVDYVRFAITDAEIWYVKKPTEMTRSETFSTTDGITIENGATYHVDEGEVTYDGTTYSMYDTFTGTAVTSFTGAGALSKITNCELPDHSMEEIVTLAAYHYLISVREHEKAKTLLQTTLMS